MRRSVADCGCGLGGADGWVSQRQQCYSPGTAKEHVCLVRLRVRSLLGILRNRLSNGFGQVGRDFGSRADPVLLELQPRLFAAVAAEVGLPLEPSLGVVVKPRPPTAVHRLDQVTNPLVALDRTEPLAKVLIA